jgi:hypothetical protein
VCHTKILMEMKGLLNNNNRYDKTTCGRNNIYLTGEEITIISKLEIGNICEDNIRERKIESERG